jgi:hypothetical protein
MHNNNITTIVAHPTPGTSKESVTQPDYLVAKFKYDARKRQYTCPQGETLKPREDGIKKVGEQSKVVINLKIQNPSCRECPVNIFVLLNSQRKRNRSDSTQSR